MKQELLQTIQQTIPQERIMLNEPMSKHTTFRVGGPAQVFIKLETVEELQNVLHLLQAEQEDYYLIGNGSNLLVSDNGYEGCILQMDKKLSHIQVQENRLICQAGATLASIAKVAYDHALTGFEFAAGIPGTLGGAIVMNAGAYGGEMKQVVESVQLLTPDGVLVEKTVEEMHFAYRHSLVKEEPYIVVGATFRLEKGEQTAIKAKMDDLASQRCDKQPLNYPSAGSTFKRPEGYFAGKLIQDAGLRGFQVGGAQVSEKHCGFVINKEHATATDIAQLIREVQSKVKEQFGVDLETEVIYLGRF